MLGVSESVRQEGKVNECPLQGPEVMAQGGNVVGKVGQKRYSLPRYT
jgi:hypothetical protein